MKNKELRIYSLYVLTVKANGKKYVGITNRPVEERWDGGHGYDHQYFGKAVRKYGWDNIDKEVLYDRCLTEAEAKAKEIYYIALYDTMNPKYGYNRTRGGDTETGTNAFSTEIICNENGEEKPVTKEEEHEPIIIKDYVYLCPLCNKWWTEDEDHAKKLNMPNIVHETKIIKKAHPFH